MAAPGRSLGVSWRSGVPGRCWSSNWRSSLAVSRMADSRRLEGTRLRAPLEEAGEEWRTEAPALELST